MENPLATLVDELTPLVERELCELEALRQLMLQEQTILLANSSDDLKLNTSEKEASIGRLERLNLKKSELFACCDMQANRFALQVLSQLSDTGKALVQEMYRAQDLSRACQRQNQVNGRIIRAQESASSKLLHILRNDTNIPLYSSAGSTQERFAGKSFGSA